MCCGSLPTTTGNVVAHITTGTVPDVVHVEPVDGARLAVELGADEPAVVRITGPGGGAGGLLAMSRRSPSGTGRYEPDSRSR